jgi:hypothetical protein
VVKQSPRGSALARAIHGEAATWGPAEHLLAAAVDALNGANWQRTGRRGHKPKPVPRPRPEQARPRQIRHLGSGPLPVAEFDAWLAAQHRKEA